MQLSKLDLRTREAALKGGAEGRGDRSRQGRGEPALPAGRGTRKARHAARRQTHRRPDRGHQGLDRPGRGLGRRAARPATAAAPDRARRHADPAGGAASTGRFRSPSALPLPAIAGLSQSDRSLPGKDRAARKDSKPAPRADRITLLRRAYLDLIGLPPTPAEAAAFLADTSPRAWENLIDRLLASPHYGERWGRHWLDVARYADSNGFEHDFDRPERLALSRLRDPRVQPGQAVQRLPCRADRRRRARPRHRRQPDRHRLPAQLRQGRTIARRTIRSSATNTWTT